MDGSRQIPVETEYPILVEVKRKVLPLENPDTDKRGAAHVGDLRYRYGDVGAGYEGHHA